MLDVLGLAILCAIGAMAAYAVLSAFVSWLRSGSDDGNGACRYACFTEWRRRSWQDSAAADRQYGVCLKRCEADHDR